MVLNLAPIGCYPAFLVQLPHNNSDLDKYGCMVSYNNAVSDYNAMLKEKLKEARAFLSDASVVYVDTHSVKLELFRRPTRHGKLLLHPLHHSNLSGLRLVGRVIGLVHWFR